MRLIGKNEESLQSSLELSSHYIGLDDVALRQQILNPSLPILRKTKLK